MAYACLLRDGPPFRLGVDDSDLNEYIGEIQLRGRFVALRALPVRGPRQLGRDRPRRRPPRPAPGGDAEVGASVDRLVLARSGAAAWSSTLTEGDGEPIGDARHRTGSATLDRMGPVLDCGAGVARPVARVPGTADHLANGARLAAGSWTARSPSRRSARRPAERAGPAEENPHGRAESSCLKSSRGTASCDRARMFSEDLIAPSWRRWRGPQRPSSRVPTGDAVIPCTGIETRTHMRIVQTTVVVSLAVSAPVPLSPPRSTWSRPRAPRTTRRTRARAAGAAASASARQDGGRAHEEQQDRRQQPARQPGSDRPWIVTMLPSRRISASSRTLHDLGAAVDALVVLVVALEAAEGQAAGEGGEEPVDAEPSAAP